METRKQKLLATTTLGYFAAQLTQKNEPKVVAPYASFDAMLEDHLTKQMRERLHG